MLVGPKLASDIPVETRVEAERPTSVEAPGAGASAPVNLLQSDDLAKPLGRVEVTDAVEARRSQAAVQRGNRLFGEVAEQPRTGRRTLSAAEETRLTSLADELKRTAPLDANGKPVADPATVARFRELYREITGVDTACAPDLVALLRDHGDALVRLNERRAKIGLTTYSAKQFDEPSAQRVMAAVFAELERSGLSLGDVSLVSGFTKLGGVRAGYQAAEQFPEVQRVGVAAAPGTFYPMEHVDEGIVVGQDWGAESPVFLDAMRDGFLVVMGGGAQAEDEARATLARSPDRVFVVEGFPFQNAAGEATPGASDKLGDAGGHHYSAERLNPEEIGTAVGKQIAAQLRQSRHDSLTPSLVKLAMEESPKSIIEVEQWMEANTGKYRLLRLLNATRKGLEAEQIPEPRINELLSTLAETLPRATTGVDNFKDNAAWQTAITETMQRAGPEMKSLAPALATDVMFASWFGVQQYRRQPSYFDTQTARLPDEVQRLDLSGAHTFDVKDYSEIRLDLKTAAFLKAHDSAPDVFVGTKQEMEDYYRAKGFHFASDLADSNGTHFYLLKKGDQAQVVVHGVDSEARLTQVGALMKASGADVSRVRVRGEVERLRQLNRNMLELELAGLQKPVAGVVIGNKNEAVETLARMTGAEPGSVKVSTPKTVGPFRYEEVSVNVAGQKDPQVLLAFAPAYGELSEDLVTAAGRVGARNFMLAGAGGSLLEGDQVGGVHRITSADYRGQLIDLAHTPGVTLLPVAGARDVRNVFSPTPLEQTQAWASKARSAGAQDVDQETGPVFRALAAMADQRPTLQSGLHQSDVVGTGGLERGTVDSAYGDNVRDMAAAFFRAVGVSGVNTPDGHTLQVAGAQAGLAAGRAAPSPIELDVPDASTVVADKAGTPQQFKGQKRILEVSSRTLSPRDREHLGELLRALPSSKFWVTARQSDPNHGDILQLARENGFESILVSSEEAARAGQIDGQPSFVIREPGEGGAQTLFDELVRDGKNDEYESNTAKHYRLNFGEPLGPARTGDISADQLDDEMGDWDLLADDIRRELSQGEQGVRRGASDLFQAAGRPRPKFWKVEDLGELFQGRTPLLFSGASKKSWATVSPEQQANVEATLSKLFEKLDPSRHVIVTGGTDHGVERIVHRLAGERGFDLLGTVTENTEANELSPNLNHLAVTGINWFGKSRPVLKEIVQRHGGQDITIGGGEILKDEARLALKLNAPLHLMAGPEGASSELASEYPSLAFSNADQLAARLGL